MRIFWQGGWVRFIDGTIGANGRTVWFWIGNLNVMFNVPFQLMKPLKRP